MAKQAVAVRLRPETLVRVDAHAKARGVSRQVVLESAVESWLVGAEGGVPELVAADPVELVQRRVPGVTTARALSRQPIDPDVVSRQARLNAAKARAK
jgi:hypothetical protein